MMVALDFLKGGRLYLLLAVDDLRGPVQPSRPEGPTAEGESRITSVPVRLRIASHKTIGEPCQRPHLNLLGSGTVCSLSPAWNVTASKSLTTNAVPSPLPLASSSSQA